MKLYKMHSQPRHVCAGFTQGISCELKLKKKMRIGVVWVDGEDTRKERSLDNDTDLGESTTCSEKSREEFRIAGNVAMSLEREERIFQIALFMWSHDSLLIAIIINGSQFLKHIYVIGTEPSTLHTNSNLIIPIAPFLFFSFSSLGVI